MDFLVRSSNVAAANSFAIFILISQRSHQLPTITNQFTGNSCFTDNSFFTDDICKGWKGHCPTPPFSISPPPIIIVQLTSFCYIFMWLFPKQNMHEYCLERQCDRKHQSANIETNSANNLWLFLRDNEARL